MQEPSYAMFVGSSMGILRDTDIVFVCRYIHFDFQIGDFQLNSGCASMHSPERRLTRQRLQHLMSCRSRLQDRSVTNIDYNMIASVNNGADRDDLPPRVQNAPFVVAVSLVCVKTKDSRGRPRIVDSSGYQSVVAGRLRRGHGAAGIGASRVAASSLPTPRRLMPLRFARLGRGAVQNDLNFQQQVSYSKSTEI